jgi:hypothetical protein
MATTERETVQKPRRPRSQIPRFKTVEEEAAYWDTHSPLDYPDEFQQVTPRVERPLEHILGVRLDAKTLEKLAAIGRKKGIGPSTLARIWIMEQIAELEAKA